MKKYDVQCPHCCGTFHETTIHFRHGVPVKGHMLTSKPHVKDAAWSTFPEYDSTEYQDIICPSCSQAYLDSLGMVIRLVETGEWPEPEAPATLHDHMVATIEKDLTEGVSASKDAVIMAMSDALNAANASTPKKKPGRPKK